MSIEDKTTSQDVEWVEIRPKRPPKFSRSAGKSSGKVFGENNVINKASRMETVYVLIIFPVNPSIPEKRDFILGRGDGLPNGSDSTNPMGCCNCHCSQ